MEAWASTMTLVSIKLFFKQSYLWLKKNWKITALGLWSIIVWFISRRNSKAVIEIMEANKESYETQIESLKKEREIERNKIKQLNLKYQETIATIEKRYSIKEKELSRKEKKKVKEIVKKAKDNPDEVDEKIEKLFGFISDN